MVKLVLNPMVSLQKGFTLIEIMFALLLIGLLTGGVVNLFKVDLDKGKHKENVESIEQIKSVLEAYLLINKHLPCPDTFSSADGLEDRSADGSCISRKGYLPTQTLDIKAVDPWRQAYFYQINARAENISRVTNICEPASVFGKTGARTKPTSFAQCSSTKQYFCNGCSAGCSGTCNFSADPRTSDAPPYFGLSTRPFGGSSTNYKNLTIRDVGGNVVDNNAVAVVVSFGQNGPQTWHNLLASGGSCNGSLHIPSNEKENCDGDSDFIAPNFQEIDDRLIWLDLYGLKFKALEKRLLD